MLSLLPEIYSPGPGLSVFVGLKCSLLLKPSPGLSPNINLGAILRGRAKYAAGPYRYILYVPGLYPYYSYRGGISAPMLYFGPSSI